ncbi:MAG: hypothetical protein AVDCRST_MAG64-3665 [uncultured Phycisphaerae bacterium]|uniref:Uncharacterized protein n=1 Tax=uncultured Phycisphaerae bacterium TaxID=904963 RepID=A0A6J4Q6G9_9BACT|nr:MAG: hypothetical protein AVDCRST_MAG64-3665 [uncultured Phycisphaerae bacterium]
MVREVVAMNRRARLITGTPGGSGRLARRATRATPGSP